MPGDWGRAYTLTGYRIGPNGSLEFFTIGRFTNEQDVQ